MRLGTMTDGGTFRMRIRNNCMSEIRTPDTLADSQRKKGTKWKKMLSTTMTAIATMIAKIGEIIGLDFGRLNVFSGLAAHEDEGVFYAGDDDGRAFVDEAVG